MMTIKVFWAVLTRHTYFLALNTCEMSFLLGCEIYSESGRQQCKHLETDRWGLQTGNKAQSRILEKSIKGATEMVQVI